MNCYKNRKISLLTKPQAIVMLGKVYLYSNVVFVTNHLHDMNIFAFTWSMMIGLIIFSYVVFVMNHLFIMGSGHPYMHKRFLNLVQCFLKLNRNFFSISNLKFIKENVKYRSMYMKGGVSAHIKIFQIKEIMRKQLTVKYISPLARNGWK